MSLPEITASDVAVPAYRVSQDGPIAEAAVSARAKAKAMTSAGAFRLVEREGVRRLDRRPRPRGRFVTSTAP